MVNLQKMPIEELVKYVNEHWQQTCLQALEAMEAYITWELAKGKSDKATPIIRTLNDYITGYPTIEKSLDSELRLSRRGFSNDAEARTNILMALRESEDARQKIQKAVDAIK